MSERQYFGTDGIRGRVDESPMTPDFVERLGLALGCVLSQGQLAGAHTSVLIGRDTRASGPILEAALIEGLLTAGLDVWMVGVLPTPAIAYLTRHLKAALGVVISASHNGYQDNGLKFFSSEGTKLSVTTENQIEEWIDSPLLEAQRQGRTRGQRFTLPEAEALYIDFCQQSFRLATDLLPLKIVVDAAQGAGYRVAPAVLESLGFEVVRLACEPNGVNINAGCGSTAPEALRKAVLAEGAQLGIALDGDADRLILVDHQGEVLNGDQILYILAKASLALGLPIQGLVGTVMSNGGLELALKQLGLPLIRTPVGDRFVLEALLERAWSLGGEASGHIICLDQATTGDALIAALRVLAAMGFLNQSLYELKQGMQPWPQVMAGVPLSKKGAWQQHWAEIQEEVGRLEQTLGSLGRIVLRPSGTEPLVRIMVEAQNQRLAEQTVKALRQFIGERIAS